MYRKGHIGVSLLAGSLLFITLPVEISLPLVVVIAATERLPDQDFNIPKLAHRGFSHTIWAAIIVATVIVGGVYAWLIYGSEALLSNLPISETLQPTPQLAGIVWIGVVLGFIVHFLGDMITVGQGRHGVKPLWPVSEWESSIQLCRADDTTWNWGLLVAGQASAITAIALQVNAITLPI